MSDIDFTAKAAMADRMIKRWGRTDAILNKRVTPTDYKDDVSWDAHGCTAVMIDYEAEDIDGKVVLATDMNAFVSVVDLTAVPKPQDEFIFNGSPYLIIRVKALAPAGQVVFYDLQVR